ncbi:hypothetical protein QMK17_21025 [Rhodococcus sp. G-MC3]|uniref:hypothetical protein n=1 Tax=Rhodococcus sp. G-MC3 TaxID=3046209 RepID=UPI0024B94CD8|nr:hypothetical protein [Rhodococcus sp. G-MC3]MDJ0395808.1 hypothetical protein [Rhodococcus sp. G-MC3]
MNAGSGKHQDEEPQSERGETGSRGFEAVGKGSADRPSGSFDDEEMQSAAPGYRDPDSDAGRQAEPEFTDEINDVEPVVPPYEGRKERADVHPQTEKAGPNAAGARGPVEDDQAKSPDPSKTPSGATASPADERPADEGSETEDSEPGVGPSHQAGVPKAEDKS